MDLVEVLSVQVAVPVLMVIFFAVLVFTFGFKSPVEPSGFDPQDRKQGPKKAKKHKSKVPTNGHIITVTAAAENEHKPRHKHATSTKQQQSVQKAAAVPKNTSKVVVKGEPKKFQNKKSGGQSQKEVQKQEESEETIDDEGGWMTKHNRKEKKQKSKKEEKVEIVDRVENDPKAQSVSVQTENELPPPQGQRTKKKSSKKQQQEESVVLQVKKHETASIVAIAETVEEPAVSPSKSAKKKLKRERTAVPPSSVTGVPAKGKAIPENIGDFEKLKNNKVANYKTPKVSRTGDLDLQQEAGETATEDDAKPARSPKKKQKNKLTKSVEKQDENKKEKAPEESLSPKSSKVSKDEPKNSSRDAKPAPEAATSLTKRNSSKLLLRDEVGDSWIEAKPKNKKRARREN